MSYTPTEWQNGDTITSAKLNNIESGVSEVNNEYTPTNWKSGDVITADKLNNIEQGIVNAEGGGGGGDITIVNGTLTIDNRTRGKATLVFPLYGDKSVVGTPYDVLASSILSVTGGNIESTTIAFPFIDDVAVALLIYDVVSPTEISADASVLNDYDFAIVGDSIITITKKVSNPTSLVFTVVYDNQ